MMNTNSKSINESIIHGYLRFVIALSIYIPAELMLEIIKFIGKYFEYYGKHSWIINEQLLCKMVNAENAIEFVFDEHFYIGPFSYNIEICPNGFSQQYIGSFDVFLALTGLPKETKIIVSTRIYCEKLKSSDTCIRTWTEDDCDSWGHYTLTLKEVKNNFENLKTLTFTVEIQILRIIKENTLYTYQQDVFYDKPFITQCFSWKIDGDLLKQMQSDLYPGKQFESKIYNKTWCLTIMPNVKEEQYAGSFDVILGLWSLPRNISQLHVNWKLKCKEINIDFDTNEWFDFDDNQEWNWSERVEMLTFENFRKFNIDSMVFDITITILDMEDNDGNVIDEKDWDKYIIVYEKCHQLKYVDNSLSSEINLNATIDIIDDILTVFN